MKWDIENKILIPFMILVILPILILGIVSYWNGYQLLINNKIKNIEANLDDHIFFMNKINEEVEKKDIAMDIAKEKAIRYFDELDKKGMVIFEGEDLILNKLNRKNIAYEKILESEVDNRGSKDLLFIHRSFDKWDWTIVYGLNKEFLTNELIEIQKYTLLVAIIFLIFSMQATILISHNISKPIKVLAEICNEIGKGNLKEKLKINRKDEIGILAEAINNMVRQLDRNTKKLIEMKNFNEDILRNISIGIITTDRAGNILSINPTGQRILEDNKNVNNQKEKLSQALIRQLKETIVDEENKNDIYVFNKSDEVNKQYLDVSTSLLRTDMDRINGAICSFNDITRRKRIENNIERINRLTSIGELAAGLAHEIRNPLAGMKMSVQVLKMRLCKDQDETNLELFDNTLYEIDRLNNLISELLDFAKPHLPKYEKTNILEILNKSLELTKKDIEEKHIKTNIHIDTNDLSAFIDKAQIEQVFINIIKNAVNSMEANGKLTIELEAFYTEDMGLLCISFEDNGSGIEQEHLEKIFNPFFTTNPQGTGLGLSVVHKLVMENNGEIDVESVINEGTKFIIKFPIYGGEIDGEKNINN